MTMICAAMNSYAVVQNLSMSFTMQAVSCEFSSQTAGTLKLNASNPNQFDQLVSPKVSIKYTGYPLIQVSEAVQSSAPPGATPGSYTNYATVTFNGAAGMSPYGNGWQFTTLNYSNATADVLTVTNTIQNTKNFTAGNWAYKNTVTCS